MKIHRYYDSAGPAPEALLMQAFKLYLALHANTAPAEAPAHTTEAA